MDFIFGEDMIDWTPWADRKAMELHIHDTITCYMSTVYTCLGSFRAAFGLTITTTAYLLASGLQCVFLNIVDYGSW